MTSHSPWNSPEQVVDERVSFILLLALKLNTNRFKKSGEFDRLRRELLAEFQHSDRMESLQSRVEAIARERLSEDSQLILQQSQEAICRELMGEVDRYPVLERAVADGPLLSDPNVAESIRSWAQRRVLNEGEIGNK